MLLKLKADGRRGGENSDKNEVTTDDVKEQGGRRHSRLTLKKRKQFNTRNTFL